MECDSHLFHHFFQSALLLKIALAACAWHQRAWCNRNNLLLCALCTWGGRNTSGGKEVSLRVQMAPLEVRLVSLQVLAVLLDLRGLGPCRKVAAQVLSVTLQTGQWLAWSKTTSSSSSGSSINSHDAHTWFTVYLHKNHKIKTRALTFKYNFLQINNGFWLEYICKVYLLREFLYYSNLFP